MNYYKLAKLYIKWVNSEYEDDFHIYVNISMKEFDKFFIFFKSINPVKWIEESCKEYIKKINNYIKDKL